MQFTYAQAESPRAAAREFAGQEGIQVREDGQASSNGMSAYYVLADAQTQGQGGQQQQVRLLTYFVEKGGTVYQFLGYSTPQEFRQYRDTFERTMRSFDEVNDEDILDVQPARLNVERDRSGTFNEIVGNVDAELAGISERDLAIMNQVELNTSIEPGRPLKLNSN
jgi:predicted Zn-dependent protease